MGIPDSSLLDLIEKVRSWIPWGGSDISGASQEFWVHSENSCKMCWECKTRVTEFSFKRHCKRCGRVLCGKCMQGRSSSLFASDGLRDAAEAEENICKFCFQGGMGYDTVGDYHERIDSSPRQSPERGFHCFDREKFNSNDNNKPSQSDHLGRFLEAQHHGSSPRAVASCSSSTDHPSPVSFRHSSSRQAFPFDEEDAEDSRKQFFSPSSEFSHDISDIDSSSISARHDFNSFKSVGSSPLDSPCRMTTTPTRAGYLLQHEEDGSPNFQKDAHPFDKQTSAILRRPEVENEDLENTYECSDDMSTFRDQYERVQQPLDFESNGLIWFPPPPDDGEDDVESDYFRYDDEDDDVGESGMIFSSSSFSTDTFSVKEKSNEEQKEPLRAVVHGHFRALVSQLLQGEGISAGNESIGEEWLDIVSSIAWQAANFVKPDTSRGGSMDPGDYVKVKCIVSGSPNESTLIKGVVCTKNIKHKRMTSQYRNPRLLLLGGSIEYQRAADQLASFNTLLQQEIDHLKMVISKIEAHRPNVLLVEKSVSSYAQEYLLAKEISLVLNVKRPLLERIARCTGALIVPSIDNLSATRLGHCEVFRLERILEDCVTANQPNKKSAKTLMFFEGCPRRLGCTVLLKGASREVLKKVKHVVQYAVFAAYHLSLETSFLADEGATLPKIPLKPPVAIPEKLMITDGAISVISNSAVPTVCLKVACQPQDLGQCSTSGTSTVHLSDDLPQNDPAMSITSELQEWESSGGLINSGDVTVLSPGVMEYGVGRECSDASNSDLVAAPVSCSQQQWKEQRSFSVVPSEHELLESSAQEEGRTLRNSSQSAEVHELTRIDRVDWNDVSNEYFSTVDNHQSILVSFSSRCVLKGTVCERSQLLRIKFYGSFDKPLGRYLRDDLFDQTSCCRSCKEPTDAHVLCYTHQQGNLTINVKRLPSLDLPGERDGKIWMWHRCLKCAHKDGVPPATRRVIMSDAAWGLSFGKFLELSFSNHATANRVANCGHSLQRDCLRYYGFGSMVAFFRYSPIDILSVRLPPSMLEFNGQVQLEWVKREAAELSNKMEVLYAEVFDVLHIIEQKGTSVGHKRSDAGEVHDHIMDLKDLLKKERNAYEDLLQPLDNEDSKPVRILDILELNRLRRCLLIDSFFWDRRLYALDSLLGTNGSTPLLDSCTLDSTTYIKLKEWRDESFCKDSRLYISSEENNSKSSMLLESPRHNLNPEPKKNSPFLDPILNELTMGQKDLKSDEGYSLEDLDLAVDHHNKDDESPGGLEVSVDKTSLECLHSPASSLSEKIDSAWTGTGNQTLKDTQPNGNQAESVGKITRIDNPSHRKLMSPARVYSFDSAVRLQERISRGLSPASLHLSSLRSFHASGDYMSMVRDPIPNMLRTFSQTSPIETQKLKFIFKSVPSFISSASQVAGEGVRLLLPQTGHNNMVIPVYDNEPTSVISYALGSKEYEDWIANKSGEHEGVWSASDGNSRGENLSSLSSFNHSATSTFSVWQSSSSIDSDDLFSRHYASEDASSTIGSLFSDPKRSPHARISFGDESSSFAGKAKFSVICYFARQFDALRKSCCPSEVDFIRSLSRGKRWNAQGGKSNVYFAKSLDDRFIIKQITKTELDSFEEFAPEYFKYLMDSLSSGSPTSLAKVLGIYQVSVKHLKGGRETKIDLMVMENLFFKRNISRVYDLKGSARSRYNSDTTGKNTVLLDMNLLETLRTNPMFLGSKAKRSLERAVWNDTSFLASVDVMDYSLLVGVDEENKELVLGIIDFMRQYTWDKHLETWVKASGILGGPKNASPTVISPKQYKKRFRKAMSTYFLTVPDQWSS
ncbi:FYVE zinc finger [Macleaya cordata]|uniref:1-phosphatidylinositol-3-phosphate 5-kinase n=1 Tax=Macleaya cordata TaxID=56857 RepID=A0A200QVP2_MACCD|nr:FYVE zinc finger [Macleaya cordata]